MGISMIVFSLILLMFFAYRGYSIIFIAPIFAVVAAIGSGHASMYEQPALFASLIAGFAGLSQVKFDI